jgi:hypothetical protein
MVDSYFLVHVFDGFRSSSYHILSDIKQVKIFTDKHGYHHGLSQIKVFGPLKVDDFEIDFREKSGKFIASIIAEHNHDAE